MQINSYKYHQYQFHHHPHHSIVHHTKTNTTVKMKSNLNVPTKCAIEMEQQPNEKYSLRQRQKRSTRNTTKQTENSTKNEQSEASSIDGVDADAAAAAAIGVDPSMDPSSSSSGGRSTKQSKSSKKSAAKTKAKQKAAPLSKYRRKTANARERIRMREINSAFEHLRECVPISFCESNPSNSNEKLTKITTLRMAMKYISTLTNMLNSSDMTMNDNDTQALLTNIMTKSANQLPMSNTFINNNNDSVTINNNNKNMNTMEMETKAMVTAVSSKSKPKGKSKKATNATANKAISKRKTTKTKATAATAKAMAMVTKSTNNKTIAMENNLMAIKSQIFESIPTNTITSLCLTPPLSSTDSPIDLGLMLESDGESLHLSEPCLSPPLSSTSTPSSSSLSSSLSNQKQFISTTVTPPASMTMSNGLDIGLFLDSDTDSLHFPEPCLSPLDGGFDAFSPFSDLLNPSGFPEHSALDIYLT